ncbi:MAG: CDP-alcohol phosphatidyltransferase family protein [Candidatus Aminicenantales bacterium]
MAAPSPTAGRPGRDGPWTLPNVLSLLRILLTPFFLWAMIGRRPLAALILFAAASLTDFLDGLAARSLSQRSALGATLDPAADKLLMTAACVACALPAISAPNALPPALVILVIGRDVAIAAGALALRRLASRKNFRPSLWGKISTILQMSCLTLVLFFNALGIRPAAFLAVLYILTFAATLISGGHYFWRDFLGRLGRQKKKA